MVTKMFSTFPPPPIPTNSWSDTDVLNSLRDFALSKGHSAFATFTLAEIRSKNTTGTGIVIIYDGNYSFTIETYDSTKTYSTDSFGISSVVLSSVAFLPSTSLGFFVQVGNVGGQTVLWVDKLIERRKLGRLYISRSGDGGGGGLTPARIPAP